jgi:hypothetical protein
VFKAVARLLVLILLLAGWSLAALSLHVVRTPNNVALVPKATLGVTDTWVDTRHWTLADVPRHPAVVLRLIDTGRADLLSFIADPTRRAELREQLSDALAKAPVAETRPAEASWRTVSFPFSF